MRVKGRKGQTVGLITMHGHKHDPSWNAFAHSRPHPGFSPPRTDKNPASRLNVQRARILRMECEEGSLSEQGWRPEGP